MCSSSYQRLNSASNSASTSVHTISNPVPRVLLVVVLLIVHLLHANTDYPTGFSGASAAESTLPTDAKVCCRNIAARAISTQDKTSVSLNYLTATAGKKSKLRRARRGPDETLLRGTCGATWHTAPTRSPPPS